ncbi:MAG: hypothetical protein PHI73_05095 [Patescibacteria group bacterium]|nr:hypothetical protein [Patescibacteria group bacterium]
MEKNISKGLFWTPRILAMIFILFLALMSLDVFGPGQGFWQTTEALFTHNLPALVLLAVLLISWKYEIVGGVGFILAGLVYIALLMRSPFEWYKLSWAMQIAGVAFLTGALFLAGWFKKRHK